MAARLLASLVFLLAVSIWQPASAATLNCPAGTTATGSGYATGGTGTLGQSVYWLDWSCGATSVFAAGDIVNKSWTLPSGVVLTGQISNISDGIRPYSTGIWPTEMLPIAYSGVNPVGLIGQVNGSNPTFTITLAASYNGVPLSSSFVVADAEDAGVGEQISVTTSGASWSVLETLGAITVGNSGSSITFSDPANGGGGTALAQTTATNVSLGVALAQGAVGLQAVAFALRTQRDHSDGPSSYGGASHVFAANLSLGASVTAEAADYNSPTSAGDDDDAVTLPQLARGVAVSVPVTVNGPGYLSAWFDWSADGDFSDLGEQVATDVQDGGAGDTDGTVNGTILLSVTPASSASLAPSTARFRWSGATGTLSSGDGPPGEVEDHAFTIGPRVPSGTSACTGTNLVTNGGFEDLGGSAQGWTVTGAGSGVDDDPARLSEGFYYFPLGGGSTESGNTIAQTISTVPGGIYTLTFDGGVTFSDTATVEVVVTAGGNAVVSQQITDTPGDGTVPRGPFSFVATGSTATVSFSLIDNVGGSDFDIDNVEVCGTHVTVSKSFVAKNDADSSSSDTAGDAVQYQFAISNAAGNNSGVSTVFVNDDKIGNIAAVPASGDANTNNVLDPGETWLVNASYSLVQADIDAESVTNTASAVGVVDAVSITSNQASVTVPLTGAPAVTVTKTASAPGFTTGDVTGAPAGTVLTYVYVVQNTGNQTIANISLSDLHNGSGAVPVPGSETISTDSAPAGDSTDAATANGVWSSLAPGDAVTFTATYTVTQQDVDLLQ